MKQYDQKWLEELDEIIAQNMSDPNFHLPELAVALGVSPAKLNRKVNELMGISPRIYIRQKKLVEAKRILELGIYPTVAEVSEAVGYKHISYFSSIFQEEFGERPFRYLRK